MLLDLAALLILGLFAGIGAIRGGIASLTGLATLVLSYFAAVSAAQNLGEGVATKLGVSPLLGPVIAGTAAFVATAIFAGVLGYALKRLASGLRGDDRISVANRWLGAGVGLVRGGFVVLMLGWLAIWIDAARQTGSFAAAAEAPPIEHSSLVRATEIVVQTAVSAAVGGDGPAGDVVARFASRPGQAVRSIQAVLGDYRIDALQQDRFFWTLISNGSYHRAMNQQSFRDVVDSVELRKSFSELGVISDVAVNDREVFRQELGAVIEEVGPRIKGLAEDPELQKLARDPEITSLLEQGDAIGLMQHRGIQQLAARVSQ